MGGTAKERKPPLLVLVGPTAAGKTALALQVASRLHTDVICADSAQVYRHMDIGTAKPTPAEQALVKHHLIDLIDPDQEFSAAAYQSAAYRIISRMELRGRLPFMVGGTGLYVKAVTDRYAFGVKGKNLLLREQLSAEARDAGIATLYNRLTRLDPRAAAKIHPRDQRRIIRALEVYYEAGRPISEQVEQTRQQDPPFNLLIFGLTMPRALLYRRIEQRVETMLDQGFLEETRALLKKGYTPDSPGLQILGYRQLIRYLNGETGWEEAIGEIKQQTRHLAKRQLTWFRKDERINWLEIKAETGSDAPAEIICARLKEILPSQANNMF